MNTLDSKANAELDALALENEEPEGDTLLRLVYNFVGEFVAFPNDVTGQHRTGNTESNI